MPNRLRAKYLRLRKAAFALSLFLCLYAVQTHAQDADTVLIDSIDHVLLIASPDLPGKGKKTLKAFSARIDLAEGESYRVYQIPERAPMQSFMLSGQATPRKRARLASVLDTLQAPYAFFALLEQSHKMVLIRAQENNLSAHIFKIGNIDDETITLNGYAELNELPVSIARDLSGYDFSQQSPSPTMTLELNGKVERVRGNKLVLDVYLAELLLPSLADKILSKGLKTTASLLVTDESRVSFPIPDGGLYTTKNASSQDLERLVDLDVVATVELPQGKGPVQIIDLSPSVM